MSEYLILDKHYDVLSSIIFPAGASFVLNLCYLKDDVKINSLLENRKKKGLKGMKESVK
jgi:hypothetical protein